MNGRQSSPFPSMISNGQSCNISQSPNIAEDSQSDLEVDESSNSPSPNDNGLPALGTMMSLIMHSSNNESMGNHEECHQKAMVDNQFDVGQNEHSDMDEDCHLLTPAHNPLKSQSPFHSATALGNMNPSMTNHFGLFPNAEMTPEQQLFHSLKKNMMMATSANQEDQSAANGQQQQASFIAQMLATSASPLAHPTLQSLFGASAGPAATANPSESSNNGTGVLNQFLTQLMVAATQQQQQQQQLLLLQQLQQSVSLNASCNLQSLSFVPIRCPFSQTVLQIKCSSANHNSTLNNWLPQLQQRKANKVSLDHFSPS